MGESAAGNGRIKRPPLDRTDPIRSFAEMLGAGSTRRPDPAARDGSGFADIARASIETAYRVVDAQLEYGRQMAQQMGFLTSAAPSNGQAPTGPADSAMDALVRAYAGGVAEMTAAWMKMFFDLTAQAQRAAPDEASTQPGESDEPRDPVPMPEPRRIFIPLALRAGEHGSVETPSLDDIEPKDISVSVLKSREGHDNYLYVQVSSAGEDHAARLAVNVPPGQPPGVYDAVISEPQGRLLGALTLTVDAG